MDKTYEREKNGLTGWICPICGRALAPWVMECPHCSKKVYDINPLKVEDEQRWRNVEDEHKYYTQTKKDITDLKERSITSQTKDVNCVEVCNSNTNDKPFAYNMTDEEKRAYYNFIKTSTVDAKQRKPLYS